MDVYVDSLPTIAFGRFHLSPRRRLLLADSQPIKLGGRAFDILLVLIEARGAIVPKSMLMARVWPDRIVDESNLQVQIKALRAALGADHELICTVAGRGYKFTGEIRALSENLERDAVVTVQESEGSSVARTTNLPEPVSELIGREEVLHDIVDLAATHRLVTLTGAGGIGKTRLAHVVARRLMSQFADGVWFSELAPLADPGLVPGAVAASVGPALCGGAISPERVAEALSGRELLLVLDNCEHVIGAAANMAEALLRAGPGVHVIATSREPLQADGERLYPVPPLTVPAEDAGDGNALGYSAVRLFLDRARAVKPQFAPDQRHAAMIAAICRRLDGIPLAIELAAARAATLGVEELAARLDDRFRLLTGGRRTALPRHKTLRAALDWSYGLLTEPERVILRRLAVFAGAFSLAAVSAVVVGPDIAAPDVAEGLFSLVAKSLVAAEVSGPVAGYRLLDTTRTYAFEKLCESGEGTAIARRHGEHCLDLFERAEAEWEMRPTAEWLSVYGRQIDDVRVALDWAFSPGGDASIGVALTAAAVPLWMQLSALDECRFRAEQALRFIDTGMNSDARRKMKLQAARGVSLAYSRSETTSETGAAWTNALEIAEGLDDVEYQLRSLWGLWYFHTVSGRYRASLALAQRFHALAANRAGLEDRLVGERLLGIALHCLGDQPGARRHLERVLASYATAHRPYMVRFPMATRIFLARVLWLQGFPEQAMRAAEKSIEDARVADHAFSLCGALALGACPIALLVGDLAVAEHYVEMLLNHSTTHALTHWGAFGTCHQGVLALKRGDTVNGSGLLRAGLAGSSNLGLQLVVLLMAEASREGGQVVEELVELKEVTGPSEEAEECWLVSDLLRIKGERLLLEGAQDMATEAEGLFRQALDQAGRQGALSLELRAATSLARLLRNQGRSVEATALLEPVYNRFTEGFDTADLKAAKALLDVLET
ncbi:MAG TPA: winged helix-turn-helix domain-containing protein [Rhodopila sp.]|jgi:predicted ATPase/DNA-binding winged helix-turn-helix (wHTH) protein|nr:winged helix-turn-helix domain-containing protein [Rhodopila sp.]